MAVGTVSAVEPNQWQYISTLDASSQTSVTFSGLSGYKQYRVVYIDAGGGSVNLGLRFNNDTGSNYYSNASIASSTGVTESTYIVLNTSSTSNAIYYDGYVDIFDADKPIEKTTEGHGSKYIGNSYGGWQNTDAITSITFLASAAMASGGSVKLYGIVA